MWVRVVVWNDFADVIRQYVKKGMLVFVEGVLNYDEHGNPSIWKNQDGEARTNYEMTANTVKFLSRSGEAQESYTSDTTTDDSSQNPYSDDSLDDDEIPF